MIRRNKESQSTQIPVLEGVDKVMDSLVKKMESNGAIVTRVSDKHDYKVEGTSISFFLTESQKSVIFYKDANPTVVAINEETKLIDYGSEITITEPSAWDNITNKLAAKGFELVKIDDDKYEIAGSNIQLISDPTQDNVTIYVGGVKSFDKDINDCEGIVNYIIRNKKMGSLVSESVPLCKVGTSDGVHETAASIDDSNKTDDYSDSEGIIRRYPAPVRLTDVFGGLPQGLQGNIIGMMSDDVGFVYKIQWSNKNYFDSPAPYDVINASAVERGILVINEVPVSEGISIESLVGITSKDKAMKAISLLSSCPSKDNDKYIEAIANKFKLTEEEVEECKKTEW